MRSRDIAFILVPNFSMIALFSALEPLRVANRYLGDVFRWRFISEFGDEVSASNAIPVSASGGIEQAGRPDLAIVCASYDYEAGMNKIMLNAMRRISRTGAALGGIDTGAFLLAEAGVLDGYKATCHWETLAAFKETYQRINVVEATYVIDQGRLTASGGPSALDMMLDWLGAIESEELAAKVAETLVVTWRKEHPGEARNLLGRRYRSDDLRVMQAISLMESHIEDVLQIGEIAVDCSLSLRQMERLFRQHLGLGPKAFYLQMRLEGAERLLTYSRMSVRDVALATGFNSLAQFSRSYKSRYAIAPSQHHRKVRSR